MDLKKALTMLGSGYLILLVTKATETGPPNVMTLAWCMPVSDSPPLLALAINTRSYTAEILSVTRECTVNVVGKKLLPKAITAGTLSGRDVDKFAQLGFKSMPASVVSPPLLGDAIVSLECTVQQELVVGNHKLYIVAPVNVVAGTGEQGTESEAPDEIVVFLGGRKFATLGRLYDYSIQEETRPTH